MSKIFIWIRNPVVYGPILAVLVTILITEVILPRVRQRKKEATEKLANFYNLAYVFVKTREAFSIEINGEIHNKENCGYFHNFEIDKDSDRIIVYDESKFLNFVTSNFSFLDDSLQKQFIEYFKVRGPEAVQKRLGCKDSNLIKVRKNLETKIVEQYNYYRKIVK